MGGGGVRAHGIRFRTFHLIFTTKGSGEFIYKMMDGEMDRSLMDRQKSVWQMDRLNDRLMD